MVRKRGSKISRDTRDIGIDVPSPPTACDDRNCPFHGRLSVRGQMFEALVVSARMEGTIVVERKYLRPRPKFERFEKGTRRMNAHSPPCLGLTDGDRVVIMECRPLSKTVSYVAVQNRGAIA